MKFFITASIICISIFGAVIFLPQSSVCAKDGEVCETSSSSISNNPRLLLINGQGDDIASQLAVWEGQKRALIERDILVITKIINDRGGQASPQINKDFSASHMIPAQDNDDAYRTYFEKLPNQPFTLLLVGKDMGIKQRWDAPTDLKNITALIDQMPMRIIEQQKRKNK